MDKFEVYVSDAVAGPALTTIIVAVGKHQEQWYGEWFVLVPKGCVLLHGRFIANEENIREGLNGTDMKEFMLSSALSYAKGVLIEHVQANNPLAVAPELRLDSKAQLMTLRLRDLCVDKMKDIIRETRCKELAEYLDLVQSFPAFERT